MEAMTISQAMKEIKNKKCSQCRRQAKGLVYRGQTAIYYCKKCLHEYMERRDQPTEEVAAG